MQARLDELVRFLALCRQDVLDAVAAEPPDPDDAERWTVADNLDHLRVVETGISKLVHVKLTRHPGTLPLEQETSSVLHRLDHIDLAQGRRLRAPESVWPVRDKSRSDALAGLQASRATLIRTLADADGVALGAFDHPHPLFGPLDLYQWILFVGHHERRHAAQILEPR